MFTEYFRELTTREKSILHWQLEPRNPVSIWSTLRWVFSSFGVITFVIASIGWMIVRDVHPIVIGPVGGVLGVAGLVALYLLIASIRGHLHWSRQEKRHQREHAPTIRLAIQDGMALVKAFEASRVVELEEFEDEGVGYIFDVGEGQLLFLKGQEYRSAEDGKPWPNSKFEIVRTRLGQHWVGLFCAGEALTPIESLKSSDLTEDALSRVREEVVHSDIESLLATVRRSRKIK